MCFLKLPSFYKIPTPIGNYTPDFGLVVQRKGLKDKTAQDYWFVIETKGTNDIYDKKNLRENERAKIMYARKHFEAAGINTIHYIAPVKDYQAGFTDIAGDLPPSRTAD